MSDSDYVESDNEFEEVAEENQGDEIPGLDAAVVAQALMASICSGKYQPKALLTEKKMAQIRDTMDCFCHGQYWAKRKNPLARTPTGLDEAVEFTAMLMKNPKFTGFMALLQRLVWSTLQLTGHIEYETRFFAKDDRIDAMLRCVAGTSIGDLFADSVVSVFD